MDETELIAKLLRLTPEEPDLVAQKLKELMGEAGC